MLHIIQILDSNNLLNNNKKLAKSDLDSFKKYWKVEIDLSINDNTKSSPIETFSQLLGMSEKICEIY